LDFDRKLFLAFAGLLLGIGVLMVYTASVTSRPTEFEQVYLSRHLGAVAAGLCLAALAALVPAERWPRWAPYLFWGTLLMLVAVLVPGVGTRVKGAQRWLRVAGVSVQPSELVKIALPLWTCALIAVRRDQLAGWWSGTIPILWPTLLVCPLVLIEPDLGTAVFLAGGTIVALFLGGWPWTRFAIGVGMLVPASAGLLLLKPYQQRRIVGFLETWSDLDAAPYQIKQSLVTLGSGGWTGEGLGQGWQKLSFLPEANTDFVFAVIGEELGLVGTLGLAAVWCGLYICGMRILSVHDVRSYRFLAGATLMTELVVQAVLNVAVVTAMVPPKGISHPLVSAGGSNLVVSLTMLGIVWGLSRPTGTLAEEDRETASVS
jgi:cell division protein FtsW